jgi:hypothetical protein
VNLSTLESFWLRVVKDEGVNPCYRWIGDTNAAGYGRFSVDGQVVRAYRWIWEQRNGPIPTGKQLHHLCENPACVNVDHLRALTPAEHNAIHDKTARRVAAWKERTHCKRGHPFSGRNLIIDRAGARQCRACRNLRQRQSRLRQMLRDTVPLDDREAQKLADVLLLAERPRVAE